MSFKSQFWQRPHSQARFLFALIGLIFGNYVIDYSFDWSNLDPSMYYPYVPEILDYIDFHLSIPGLIVGYLFGRYTIDIVFIDELNYEQENLQLAINALPQKAEVQRALATLCGYIAGANGRPSLAWRNNIFNVQLPLLSLNDGAYDFYLQNFKVGLKASRAPQRAFANINLHALDYKSDAFKSFAFYYCIQSALCTGFIDPKTKERLLEVAIGLELNRNVAEQWIERDADYVSSPTERFNHRRYLSHQYWNDLYAREEQLKVKAEAEAKARERARQESARKSNFNSSSSSSNNYRQSSSSNSSSSTGNSSGFKYKIDACLATLGLKYGVDFAEIKRVHRNLMSKYHPDKIQALPKSEQQSYLNKATEIQAAYNYICEYYHQR